MLATGLHPRQPCVTPSVAPGLHPRHPCVTPSPQASCTLRLRTQRTTPCRTHTQPQMRIQHAPGRPSPQHPADARQGCFSGAGAEQLNPLQSGFRASRAPGRRVHPRTHSPTHDPADPLEPRGAEREQRLRVDDGVRLQRGLHVGLVPVVLEAVGEVPVHRLPQAALPRRALAPACARRACALTGIAQLWPYPADVGPCMCVHVPAALPGLSRASQHFHSPLPGNTVCSSCLTVSYRQSACHANWEQDAYSTGARSKDGDLLQSVCAPSAASFWSQM